MNTGNQPLRAGGLAADHEVLWVPPREAWARTRMGDYLDWVAREQGYAFADYPELWRWSVDDLPAFWASIWNYFDVPAYSQPTAILTDADRMPDARWFPGARLNYAQAVLRMPGLADGDTAVIAHSQTRRPVHYTVAELRDQVARARRGLRELGVGRGDRVAAYLPNIPETLVLMLATASLGAIFTSCPPEFGARSVIDRLGQIEPKVLVVVDGYRYGARSIDRSADVDEIRSALTGLAHLVQLPYLHPTAPPMSGASSWHELLGRAGEFTFEPVPFEHPLYVLYSSGTTGLPKPIVHGHGGILLEHLKSIALHHDLGPGDRFLWFTTTGWMMWNYLVSGLAVGSAVVLFDGDPGYPDLTGLWELAATTHTSYLGTSAPFLLACRKSGLSPKTAVDLSALRGLGSTGAPLPAAGYRWVYDEVAADIYFASISGGTDLCTAFLGGAPLLPVRAGVMACRALGADVQSIDEEGWPVLGREGELVISKPMPSMPVGLWGDVERVRYRETYFGAIPGLWRHGDWITIAEDGSCVIGGRSDATLNRGGVRLGTAEFYGVVDAMPEIRDSLVIHLSDNDSGADELILFIDLEEGRDLDLALRQRIAARLRAELSPRHVPDEIHQVPEIPRTLSGKKLEIPVKQILRGARPETVTAAGVLADAEALRPFVELRERRSGAAGSAARDHRKL
ncbi:acetoacetyl-CoA synthetase [Nocardia tenerifensis]|uniref:Acetoacetyl-CoA synthetase n=1 Tax=Nocardia tenerifensis TaxID=228006 RepID=A0A318L0C1_9NOCA|nr:acetoacetate--CoA ligase [Nocardia tenerifensis]PXX71574.1 acetoacetyl-CoA synthetase [Nocardia tenerifensis]